MKLVGLKGNTVTGWHDVSDPMYPIELGVNGEYVWITTDQALELAEFLVEAVVKTVIEIKNNTKEKEEKTNGSKLQET